MADNSIKILIEAQNKASKELQAVKKELEGLKKATKDTGTEGGKSVGGLLDQFRNLKMGAVPYLAALGVAVGAFKKTIEFSREGAELEFTGEKFERLAETVGSTKDAMLRDLREVSKGTISDFELMASATDFMALGLAKSHDEVVRLTNVASALGMNMNQLVLTLTNQTTMRFDAIGVSVDGFKEKVKALEDAGMSASDAFKEAFLRQAEEQIQRVGNAADAAIGDFKRLEAAIKNFGDAAKISLADKLAPAVEVTADMFSVWAKRMQDNQAFNDLAKQLEGAGVNIEEFNARFSDTKNFAGWIVDVEGFEQLLIDMQNSIPMTAAEIDALVMSVFNGTDSWEEFVAGMDKAGIGLGMMTEELYNTEKVAGSAGEGVTKAMGASEASTKVALSALQTLSGEYEKQRGILENDLAKAYDALGQAATNFKNGVAGDLVQGLEDAGLEGDDMLERLQLIDEFAGTQYAIDFMMEMEMPELLQRLLDDPDSFLTEAEKFKDYFLPLQNSYKIASEKIDSLQNQLKGLERTYTAHVQVIYSIVGIPDPNVTLGGTAGGGGGGGVVARTEAAGGIVHAAAGAFGKQAYYVGEIGPETFFPAQDGRILSNSETKAALRSGRGGGETINVVINTPMNFADRLWVENELAPYIRDAIQKQAIRG